MDIETLLAKYLVAFIMIACLGIGWVLKHSSLTKKIPNNDIPCILAIIGALLNMAMSGWTIVNGVAGFLSGLSATGFYEQVFKNWLAGRKNTTEKEV